MFARFSTVDISKVYNKCFHFTNSQFKYLFRMNNLSTFLFPSKKKRVESYLVVPPDSLAGKMEAKITKTGM